MAGPFHQDDARKTGCPRQRVGNDREKNASHPWRTASLSSSLQAPWCPEPSASGMETGIGEGTMLKLGFPGGPVVENPPANAGDADWIPGTTKPVCHNYQSR